MASFHGKIGWKRPRKRENKIIVPFRSFPKGNRKFQKSRKIFKKLKKTIMASFHGKIGWKRPRKRENKNYRTVSFFLEG